MKISGMLHNERGVALMIAMAAALVVTITASVVLSMAYGRFHQAAFQSDRAEADMAAEGGLQYAIARVPIDATLQGKIFAIRPNPYTISPTAANTASSEQDLGLQMGTATRPRNVKVELTYVSGTVGQPDFKVSVKASTTYAE